MSFPLMYLTIRLQNNAKQMATHGVTSPSNVKSLKMTQYTVRKKILVYIPLNLAGKVPASEIIKYDEDEYRIFYNHDQITHFIRHQFGHTKQSCEYNIKTRKIPKITLTQK